MPGATAARASSSPGSIPGPQPYRRRRRHSARYLRRLTAGPKELGEAQPDPGGDEEEGRKSGGRLDLGRRSRDQKMARCNLEAEQTVRKMRPRYYFSAKMATAKWKGPTRQPVTACGAKASRFLVAPLRQAQSPRR